MQHFRSAFFKRLCIIIALILTVQTICLCCVSVAFSAERKTADASGVRLSDETPDSYVAFFNEKVYSATHNRARWLYDLMSYTDPDLSLDRADVGSLYAEAKRRGILGGYTVDDLYEPLERRFAADTLCRALQYPHRRAGYLADVSSVEYYMADMAYYGYFLPDVNYRMHPDAAVTPDEYASLLTELSRYQLLHGKRVLSFGDSIMYGAGNGGEGIADMLAEKYGMTVSDYSVSGATMGVSKGRSHIPDQVRKAAAAKEKADIILLNGGTNDMFATALGQIKDGFDREKAGEDDYSGGFEKTMWLLQKTYADVPVVYVRCHNMKLVSAEREERFGERGVEIAAKRNAATVDIYSESGLNTEDPAQSARYTYLDPDKGYVSDAIHPTAIGYAKFYLPLISQTVVQRFSKEASV